MRYLVSVARTNRKDLVITYKLKSISAARLADRPMVKSGGVVVLILETETERREKLKLLKMTRSNDKRHAMEVFSLDVTN